MDGRSQIHSLLLLLLLLNCVVAKKQCREGMSEGQIVDAISLRVPSKHNLPDSDGMLVSVELSIQDITALNEMTSDFEIHILYSQIWHDPRLAFDNMTDCVDNIMMEPVWLERIWTPNVCLLNSKSSVIQKSPTDNIFVCLGRKGEIWTNHRLRVKGPCQLGLKMFPFDIVSCWLTFESINHNVEVVKLQWREENPINLLKQIQLPDFDLLSLKIGNSSLDYPNGVWDQLNVTFNFERRWGFYLLQAYIPTYITIFVSWVGFFMDPKALPARAIVGVNSLLALTFQMGNIIQNLPRVSFIKAMDVWMLGCISFVFGTTVELAIICFIGKKQTIAHRLRTALLRPPLKYGYNNAYADLHPALYSRRKSVSARLASLWSDEAEMSLGWDPRKRPSLHPLANSPGPTGTSISPTGETVLERIDRISLMIFPIAFLLFNITYWSYYLSYAYSNDKRRDVREDIGTVTLRPMGNQPEPL